ncbi:MAG: ornithine aminotransferase [Bacteroidota bacterium]|jgi:osmotically-inducible protein OsmY|nr:ornithine aminotransferase [Bacteroidota bacterium]
MKTGMEHPNDGKGAFNWNANNSETNQANGMKNQHFSSRTFSEKYIQKPSAHDDLELKKSVAAIIKWNSSIDETKIRIEVKNGWVTLEGTVDMDYKRLKAGLLARDIKGVTGVTNLVIVTNNLSGKA